MWISMRSRVFLDRSLYMISLTDRVFFIYFLCYKLRSMSTQPYSVSMSDVACADPADAFEVARVLVAMHHAEKTSDTGRLWSDVKTTCRSNAEAYV